MIKILFQLPNLVGKLAVKTLVEALAFIRECYEQGGQAKIERDEKTKD
jgi:hypothetical protein